MKLPLRQRLVVLSIATVVNALILLTTYNLLSLRDSPAVYNRSNKSCHVAPSVRDFAVKFTSVEKAFEAAQIAVSEEVVREELRIGKCSVMDDPFNPVYKHTLELHERHNTIHNYAFHILQRPIIDNVWSKPAHILSVLLIELSKPRSQRLDWLFWVDADTVVMNPKIPLSAFMPPDEVVDDYEPNLLIARDSRGLNTGAFLLRVHHWSVELLSSIIASRTYEADLHTSLSSSNQEKVMTAAMSTQLTRDPFRDQTVFVPQHWFNAYPPNVPGNYQHQGVVQDGGLLVHITGGDDEYNDDDTYTYPPNKKTDLLQDWLDFSEMKHPAWTLELHQTNIPKEAESFWNAYAAARRASWERDMELQVQMGPGGKKRERRRHELEEQEERRWGWDDGEEEEKKEEEEEEQEV